MFLKRLPQYVVALCLLTAFASAQYNSETVTEKSFENSSAFFESHFLNPYGLNTYRDLAVGFIRNPFLDIQQNPANLPKLENGRTHIYLDFRGDRNEEALVESFATPVYAGLDVATSYYYPIIDPRWYAVSRQEPEPVFSLGAMTYLTDPDKNPLLIGGSYQLVHRNDPFYQVPNYIYASRFGYSSALDEGAVVNQVPIIDRYSGSDELITQGHYFSGFLGYGLGSRVNLGLSLNAVVHDRDGIYRNASQDEFGSIDDWERFSDNSRERDQAYEHIDLSGGLRFQVSDASAFGIKAGVLNGRADQTFSSFDTSFYDYQSRGLDDNRSFNISGGNTSQSWERDGSTIYGRLHFDRHINDDATLRAQYRFSQSDVDLVNSSAISDTGYYESRWTYNTQSSEGFYEHFLSDVRSATGTREKTAHLGQVAIEWTLSRRSTLLTGINYMRSNTIINTIEPVIARQNTQSFYTWTYQGSQDTSQYVYRNFEDKTLDWNYESSQWSIQIPVLARFQVSKNWRLMLGVNRILRDWNIKEVTTARFRIRERTDRGTTSSETNFGERYTQPNQKLTEQSTDFISSVEAQISEKLRINLLVEPDFEEGIRFNQVWLTFQAEI